MSEAGPARRRRDPSEVGGERHARHEANAAPAATPVYVRLVLHDPKRWRGWFTDRQWEVLDAVYEGGAGRERLKTKVADELGITRDALNDALRRAVELSVEAFYFDRANKAWHLWKQGKAARPAEHEFETVRQGRARNRRTKRGRVPARGEVKPVDVEREREQAIAEQDADKARGHRMTPQRGGMGYDDLWASEQRLLGLDDGEAEDD